MIYTGSYFTLPKNFKGLKIQISNSKPKWFDVDMSIPQLFPDWKQVENYKKTKDEETYTKAYMAKISQYDPERVKKYLNKLAEDVVLLCWEPQGFCHRHLLSKWLGPEINEIKQEKPQQFSLC